ncbi:TPT-domain-containing protein [Dothidotthia symphoricarpi CBS 119687]|uniref:TPT-domain-containing protein n=1 Tax=Dothidotthia symphoricarpi CBS 119687 TaxID=1392245 RepID=A0A6A6AB79_9PLEO|nr:TPT-domain-containing protein [Dothidotthia symphoricarpi CBS 119687]KAF2129029.1 TPT-domain-containing protein [Dothidotthia symphoricarpi CBS 119687]
MPASVRDPSPQNTFKFPAFQPELLPTPEDYPYGLSSSRTPSPGQPTQANGSVTHAERWQPRKEVRAGFANGLGLSAAARHGRQKSLTEAFRTIRTRNGSVSQNAHEIADALKAPLSPKLVMLCGVWYLTSIFTNMSSKAILTALPKPITLTTVQFAFVSGWCIVLATLARKYPRLKQTMPFLKNGIRRPTKELIMTTLPLTLFQIGGHILSADATSRIPVSLVHTIKGLSPLLTVLAYSIFFKIRYAMPTYLSLIPLTLGVVLACSADFNANFIGLFSAFASAILFVVQNIVSKQIFNDAATAERDGIPLNRFTKPDKLNLLCYSSGLAFLFTIPLWLWSEGFTLLGDFLHDASIELSDHPGAFDHGRLFLEFLFNGTFHFGQNIVAFLLLSMVSPVTYSVASLIKRVFVIVFAIIWFKKPMTSVQAFGFVLTFAGLYLYDRTSDAAKADKRAKALQSKSQGTLLPLVTDVNARPTFSTSPATISGGTGGYPLAGIPEARDAKKDDDAGYGRPGTGPSYLPPGTKQEDTWRPHEMNGRRGIGVL